MANARYNWWTSGGNDANSRSLPMPSGLKGKNVLATGAGALDTDPAPVGATFIEIDVTTKSRAENRTQGGVATVNSAPIFAESSRQFPCIEGDVFSLIEAV